MGVISEYLHPRRNLIHCTFQRVQGSGRPELRLCLCSSQRGGSGAFLPFAVTVTSACAYLRIQLYGYALYQHRITLIRRRDPGSFGECSTISGELLTDWRRNHRPDCRASYHQRLPLHCRAEQLRHPRFVHITSRLRKLWTHLYLLQLLLTEKRSCGFSQGDVSRRCDLARE